jgi:hypothetical protein
MKIKQFDYNQWVKWFKTLNSAEKNRVIVDHCTGKKVFNIGYMGSYGAI